MLILRGNANDNITLLQSNQRQILLETNSGLQESVSTRQIASSGLDVSRRTVRKTPLLTVAHQS